MPEESIVPEGFDLEAAKRKQSTTPKEEMKQCPDCGAVSLSPRTGKFAADPVEWDYYCDICHAKLTEADLHE